MINRFNKELHPVLKQSLKRDELLGSYKSNCRLSALDYEEVSFFASIICVCRLNIILFSHVEDSRHHRQGINDMEEAVARKTWHRAYLVLEGDSPFFVSVFTSPRSSTDAHSFTIVVENLTQGYDYKFRCEVRCGTKCDVSLFSSLQRPRFGGGHTKGGYVLRTIENLNASS